MNSSSISTFDEKLAGYFTNCTITSKYDVICFEFYLYTESFDFRRYPHDGFKLTGHNMIYPEDDAFYLIWEIDSFQNTTTGNLIIYKMSSVIYKDFEKCYLVRIEFHNELGTITATEINQFLDQVISAYKIFTKELDKHDWQYKRLCKLPKPVLSKVEVTCDVTGEHLYFLHDNMRDNLHKARCRKKHSKSDEEEITYKDTFDGRILCSVFPTNYISNSYRDYVYFDDMGNETFRFETIIPRDYLQRHELKTLADLESFDKVRYWTDHYFFFRFEKERILNYVRKNKPELVQSIAILLDSQDLFTPSEIYEKLKNDYSLYGSPLFPNPSRQLMSSKWHEFDKMIQEALSKLTLSEQPAGTRVPFQPIQRKRDIPSIGRGRKSQLEVVRQASESLEQKGIKVTNQSIAEETGLSKRTVIKHRHKLNQEGRKTAL